MRIEQQPNSQRFRLIDERGQTKALNLTYDAAYNMRADLTGNQRVISATSYFKLIRGKWQRILTTRGGVRT